MYHNYFKRHWEYSEECFKIIKLYKETYPEVFECVYRAIKEDTQVVSIEDFFEGVNV